MIFRSQNPLSPLVEVTVGNVYIDYLRIVQVEMVLAENSHDLVRITMAGLQPEAISDYINAPVTITWYQDEVPTGNEFRGYITYLEPQFTNNQGTVNNSPFQLTVLHCLGASFDMRAKVVKFWESPSLLDIVRDIGNKYQYSWSVPEDSFRFTRLAQTEESDWEFLVRVCDTLGYSVTTHNTHIHVFDRFKALGRQVSYHRLEVPMSSASNRFKVRPGQILNMKFVAGSTTNAADTNTEYLNSLDNEGNLLGTNPAIRTSGLGAPLDSGIEDQLAMNAVSHDYAQRMVEGRARKKYPVKAVLETTGVAGVKPGGVVNIQKFNTQFDGLWYVHAVTHTVTFDKFFSELTVLKDSTNDEQVSIQPAETFEEIPESVFLDSRWKARNQMEEVYG